MDTKSNATDPRDAGATSPDDKALEESAEPTVSEENPTGFKNDPDDPTNPNEAIERSRRQLRPVPLETPANAKK